MATKFLAMPLCRNCAHPGSWHNWKVQRIRGRCDILICFCPGYAPDVKRTPPLNSFIGRLRWKR